MSIKLHEVVLRQGKATVLEGVSAELKLGQITGIIGPNGSGKSSLLKAIYGYLPLSSGSIVVDGKSINEWSASHLAGLMGVCPQVPEQSLDFQVKKVLTLSLKSQGSSLIERLSSLNFLEIQALLGKNLSQLSGGERQRVRLAMAILADSPWLILDEPANHLDISTVWSLVNYLKDQKSKGIILAIHDLNLALRLCHQVVVLHRGKKVAEGTPATALSRQNLETVFSIQGQIVDSHQGHILDIEGVIPA